MWKGLMRLMKFYNNFNLKYKKQFFNKLTSPAIMLKQKMIIRMIESHNLNVSDAFKRMLDHS
jgi:hypothetical protein